MRRVTSFLTSTGGRFLAVGAVSYIVNQAALVLLYDGGLTGLPRSLATPLGKANPALLVASLVAVEVSILVRFLLNDAWTFRGRGDDKTFGQRLYQSNLSSLASPVISLACVNLLTPILGISYLVSNSLGVLLGLAWNWLWSTRVVWRPASDTSLKLGIQGR